MTLKEKFNLIRSTATIHYHNNFLSNIIISLRDMLHPTWSQITRDFSIYRWECNCQKAINYVHGKSSRLATANIWTSEKFVIHWQQPWFLLPFGRYVYLGMFHDTWTWDRRPTRPPILHSNMYSGRVIYRARKKYSTFVFFRRFLHLEIKIFDFFHKTLKYSPFCRYLSIFMQFS